MTEVEVRPLRPEDDRRSFRSGDPDLGRFFAKYAGQNQFKHHIGTTYVAVLDGLIVGFATVSAAAIAVDELSASLSRRLPRYPLPVLRLARMAVDTRVQGQGLGAQLLKAVFVLALEMAQRVGCIGVVVDAKDKAVDFYKNYGFEPIRLVEGELGDRPRPLPMFLALGSVPRP